MTQFLLPILPGSSRPERPIQCVCRPAWQVWIRRRPKNFQEPFRDGSADMVGIPLTLRQQPFRRTFDSCGPSAALGIRIDSKFPLNESQQKINRQNADHGNPTPDDTRHRSTTAWIDFSNSFESVLAISGRETQSQKLSCGFLLARSLAV